MPNSTTNPRWPKLLSLTVHEFRTPLTVVTGYIQMLLKDRAGHLSDAQRHLLEEAEKSCARLSCLLAEVSELSALEGAAAPFNCAPLDLRVVLGESLKTLPDLPDRQVHLELSMPVEPLTIFGDATRLRQALSAVIAALRREVVTSDRLFVHAAPRTLDGTTNVRLSIAEATRLDRVRASGPDELTTFDEWRGGCGLSLANARRVIEAHGGFIWSPRDESKAAAAIEFPAS
jgi:signal transduction histidine kinase